MNFYFMYYRYIVSGSITNAIKGKKALLRNRLPASVQRLAKAQELYGCGYCIAVPSEVLGEAIELLSARGIKYKGILDSGVYSDW